MSGGSVVALAVIVVVALVATGVGVFLVTRNGGDGASPSTDVPSLATTADDGPSSGPTLPPVPTRPTDPETTNPDTPTTDDPLGGLGEGLIPGGTGVPGNVPEQLPQPEGATASDFGLEVDMAVDAVATFYESALATEGYTVTDAESPLAGGQALAVEGNGITGQLLIAVIGGPETSVLWVPS